MNQNPADQDRWEPCPDGAVRGAVRTVRARRRTKNAMRVTTLCAGVVIVGVALYGATQLPGDGPTATDFGGISCAETQAVLAAFIDGSLEADMTRKVEQHLARCEICPPRLREMRAARMASVVTGGRRPELCCADPRCAQGREWLLAYHER